MDAGSRIALNGIARNFLEGRLRPLEAAVVLATFEDDAPHDIKDCLIAMVGVASATDHILLGDRRDLWRPKVRALKDQEHDEAQAWAEPVVRETCERLPQGV
jgi:hypothetical protein